MLRTNPDGTTKIVRDKYDTRFNPTPTPIKPPACFGGTLDVYRLMKKEKKK